MKEKNIKLNLCISKHCFLNCLGCFNDFSSKPDCPYANIIEFLKFARKQGVEKITLSGGDPLAKENIANFISAIKKMGFSINLDTVGTPFITNAEITQTKEMIHQIDNFEIFKKVDMLGIPLDGSTNEVQLLFRQGRYNLFDEQLAVIKKLHKNGIKVCINTVLHKGNYADLMNIFNLIKQFPNIVKWQIFQFAPIGPKGKANSAAFAINPAEFAVAKNNIMNIANNEFEIYLRIISTD